MNNITARRRGMWTNVKGLGLCILGLAMLFGMTELAVPPASAAPPKTGPTGKTEKQCNADHKTCQKNCEKTIIDVGNQVQQCKDRCTDTMVLCQPAARAPHGGVGGIPGGDLQVAPDNPAPKTSPFQKSNAPIMRRGIDGDQSSEPAPGAPTESTPAQSKPVE